MQTRQILAAITATTAGTAYIQLPTRARVRKFSWACHMAGAPTTADFLVAELSLSSSGQTATNDAAGILDVWSISGFLTTSGGLWMPMFKESFVDFVIGAGDRIYLNAVEQGSGSYTVRVLAHYQ